MFPQENQVRQMRSQLQLKESQIINYQNTTNKLENEVKGLKDERDQLLQELNRRGQSHVNLENQLQRLQKELKQKSGWCESLQLQLNNNKVQYQEQDQAAKQVLNEMQQKDDQIRTLTTKIQEIGKECEHYMLQCRTADERFGSMRSRFEQQIQELQNNVNSLSMKLDFAYVEKQGLQSKLSDLGRHNYGNRQSGNDDGKVVELEKLVENLKTSLQKAEQENYGLREHLKNTESLTDEKVNLQLQVESLQKQVAEAREDCDYNYEMAGKLKSAMIELDAKASAQFEEVFNQKTSLESQLSSLKKDYKQVVKQNQELQQAEADLKTQLDHRCEELMQQKQIAETNQLQTHDAAVKERDEMKQQLQQVCQQLQSQEAKVTGLRQELEAARFEVTENNKIILQLQENVSQLRSDREKVSEELRVNRAELEQQQSKHQQSSEELNQTIQTLRSYNCKGMETLKEREQLIMSLQEKLSELNEQINQVKLESDGCKDQIAEKDEFISQMRAQMQILEQSKNQNVELVESLRQELRSMADGKENVSSNVFSLQQRISQLELELAESSKQQTLLSRERMEIIARYDATVRHLKEDLEAKQQILNYLQKQLATAEQMKEENEFRISELETQKNSILDSCEQLELNLETHQTERVLLEKKNQDLLEQVKTKETQLTILEGNMEELDSERLQMMNTINQQISEKKQALEKILKLESQVGGLQGDQVDLGQQTSLQEEQLEHQQKIISNQKEEIDKLREKVEQYRQKHLEQFSKISSEHILQEKLQEIEQLKNELVMERRSCQTLAQQLHQEQERFDRELGSLKQQADVAFTPTKQSPGLSPINTSFEAQLSLLRQLNSNLTRSNQKLTQKTKDYARKLKLATAKYENLKKQLEIGGKGVFDEGGSQTVVVSEDEYISPISEQLESEDAQKFKSPEKEIPIGGFIESNENKDPLKGGEDGEEQSYQLKVIPETPESHNNAEEAQPGEHKLESYELEKQEVEKNTFSQTSTLLQRFEQHEKELEDMEVDVHNSED